MKKVFSVLLICGLTLLCAQASWAAIHPVSSDFTNWSSLSEVEWKMILPPSNDKWFDVSPLQPALNLEAVVLTAEGSSKDLKVIRGSYTKNEQTFANVYYAEQINSSEGLSGSYLFGSGIFAGVDYLHTENDDLSDLSVGYRYNLGEQGFVSLSANYYGSDSDSGIGGYEVDGVYYLDQAKLFGELYFPAEDGSIFGDTDPYIMLGAHLAVNDELTVGAELETYDDHTGWLAGLTWSRDSLILNGKLGKSFLADADYYGVGGAYQFDENWSLGASYLKFNEADDPNYALKVAYKTGIMTFSFTWSKDPVLF